MRPDPRYELAWASQVPHSQTEHPETSAVAVNHEDDDDDDEVVMAPSVKGLESRLVKFWKDQPMVFDYKEELRL